MCAHASGNTNAIKCIYIYTYYVYIYDYICGD